MTFKIETKMTIYLLYKQVIQKARAACEMSKGTVSDSVKYERSHGNV